ALRFAGRSNSFDRGLNDSVKFDGFHVQPKLSAQGARDIEKIIDDLHLCFRVPLDQLKRLGEYFWIVRLTAQHVHAAKNRRQGSAEFVRNDRYEFIFQPVGALSFVVET